MKSCSVNEIQNFFGFTSPSRTANFVIMQGPCSMGNLFGYVTFVKDKSRIWIYTVIKLISEQMNDNQSNSLTVFECSLFFQEILEKILEYTRIFQSFGFNKKIQKRSHGLVFSLKSPDGLVNAKCLVDA